MTGINASKIIQNLQFVNSFGLFIACIFSFWFFHFAIWVQCSRARIASSVPTHISTHEESERKEEKSRVSFGFSFLFLPTGSGAHRPGAPGGARGWRRSLLCLLNTDREMGPVIELCGPDIQLLPPLSRSDTDAIICLCGGREPSPRPFGDLKDFHLR